jgi:hypothetical protein
MGFRSWEFLFAGRRRHLQELLALKKANHVFSYHLLMRS